MSNIGIAKKIGYKQAFKAITIGLIVAYLIMAVFAGPVWIFSFSYTPTILFSVFVLYGFGFIFGSLAGKIIIIKNLPSILVGIISGFLIVWSATFVGSLIGFFNEVFQNHSSISESIKDYLFKPLMIITFYGFIPIIGVGIWYGISIKTHARKNESD